MKVLVGVGLDRKEYLELNLYVYGGDDTMIIVYNMREWPERKGDLENNPLNLCN